MYEITHWVWYLAFQDGPANNDRYETEQEAKDALKRLGKDGKRGICVMSKISAKYVLSKLP